MSSSQVSRLATTLDAKVAEFRNRPLDAGPYRYVWIDALVRHEALENRVVMKGHHRWSVAADRPKLRPA